MSEARKILPKEILIQVPPNLVNIDREKNEINHENNHGSAEDSNNGNDLIHTSKNSRKYSNEINSTTNYEVNLNRDDFLFSLLQSGVTDLGGISPVDEVNPTYKFQQIKSLKKKLKNHNYELVQRLPVHERHFSFLSDRVKKIVDDKYSNFYSEFG